jgi:hypothetical protein
MALLDMLQQHLGQSAVGQISDQLGVSPGVAQTAIAAALPMILAGMARHASSPQGADAIHQAAQTHEGTLDNVQDVLRAGPPADHGGLLGRVLGGHQQTVEQGVQQASGLDPEKAKKLLLMLSPIVVAALARHQFGGGGGGGQGTQAAPSKQDISSTLQEEAAAAQQHAQRQAPQLGGLLGQIFGAR